MQEAVAVALLLVVPMEYAAYNARLAGGGDDLVMRTHICMGMC
jgi:hypothetical protein